LRSNHWPCVSPSGLRRPCWSGAGWHTFATLLPDANVDPLVRQITLGRRPTNRSGLDMTANSTRTRAEPQRQIELALRLWPESLCYPIDRMRQGE